MAIPKIEGSQRDFSAGELDVSMKRSDDNPIMKAGARQMSNWRIRNSKSLINRPGRSAVFVASGRVDEVVMSPGNTFFINFGNGSLKIFNAAGAQVFTSTKKGDGTTNLPWTTATVKNINWVAAPGALRMIYITYAETVAPSGQKRTPFYRLSPQSITLLPSATTGNINITFSEPVLVAAHVGTRMRFCGRQIYITAFTTSKTGTATVVEPLPPAQRLVFSGGTGALFNVGDLVIGASSGASGIVGAASTSQQTLTFLNLNVTGTFLVGNAITGGTSGATATVLSVTYTPEVPATIGSPAIPGFSTMLVLLSTGTAFNSSELVTGPGGSATNTSAAGGGSNIDVQLLPKASGNIVFFLSTENIAGPSGVGTLTSVSTIAPLAVSVWDDEVMNSQLRGWPSSVFFDQGRLGFCNVPALAGGIIWSAFGLPNDLYVGANPTDAMFEIAPGKSRVLYVVPGIEGSEFVFCDNGAYYIPISVTNPLIPGSVAFNLLSRDGCAAVQPRNVQDVILWINAGLTSILAVVGIGAYNRPYDVKNISELHAHLFSAPIAIAAPTTTEQFEERYVYVLNDDGTVAVGKYQTESGQIKGTVGWLPWSGVGTVGWASAFGSDVTFSTAYAPNGITAVNLVEQLDATQYLDAAISVNPPVTAMQQAQPAGTNFGNMTGDGGLAAAFNGTRTQLKAASATLAAADGYVGRFFTTPQVIGQALVWPSSNSGFVIGGTGDITIELRAKATLPANSTDGTLLATATLTADQTTGPVILNPQYDTTTYAYAFIRIAQSGATSVICAQFLPQSGPLWWLAGGTVDLIDDVTRMMGTYTIDASGNIIPQNNGGENLSSTELVAGQPWTAILEPFVPDAQPGQDFGQRMLKRRVSRMAVYVIDSTGFLLARLFSGPLTPTSPALGAIVNTRRIPTWNQGDDPTLAPPLREEVQRWRPIGRAFDPRVCVIKDTPGPLEIPELGIEVTI